MTGSILDDTKKSLGIPPEHDSFDPDVIMHVNSAIGVLTQLGIGPEGGFMITDDGATWDSLLYLKAGTPELALNMVKSFVYFKVKLAFDPPNTPHGISAIEKQIDELTWRINIYRESKDYLDPVPSGIVVDPLAEPV